MVISRGKDDHVQYVPRCTLVLPVLSGAPTSAERRVEDGRTIGSVLSSITSYQSRHRRLRYVYYTAYTVIFYPDSGVLQYQVPGTVHSTPIYYTVQ